MTTNPCQGSEITLLVLVFNCRGISAAHPLFTNTLHQTTLQVKPMKNTSGVWNNNCMNLISANTH
ncbi:MAG: hypothetical protein WCS58_07925, partial [Candidatus Cloacimonadaceae bacterium]|nr:hypothetical protein [Candidatus Cloacimonadota bacterium]